LSSSIANFTVLNASATVVTTVTLLTRQASADNLGKLLVFLHATVKQRALQQAMEAALPEVEVVGVNRVNDFERVLKGGVDAVLTLPVVLSAFKLGEQLRGYRAGSSEESYALVGVDRAPEPGEVATVGALNLLGREGTSAYVSQLLGFSPRVERVTKIEDLLRLLQAQVVDAVLMPTRVVKEVRETSRLNLISWGLSRPFGLPAAVGLSVKGPKVLGALKRMPEQVSKTLGVDTWR
jgi:hypothetical protein